MQPLDFMKKFRGRRDLLKRSLLYWTILGISLIQPFESFSQLQVPKASGGQVSLQFPDNPVNDILAIYGRLIGKTVIRDSAIREGPNVSLITPSEVPKEEAIKLIEATLRLSGYVLVADPGKSSVTILRGGNREGGQSPSFSEEVTFYPAPLKTSKGDTLVGYFMNLEYISPKDAATIFQNHISLNEFGKITPVSSPPGLLITETSPIIRSLIRLRTMIDRPGQEAAKPDGIDETVRSKRSEP
jgi:type II secretory pathway component GspD/PulD (secretin)